jgi:FtsH-binding integral membrane protein
MSSKITKVNKVNKTSKPSKSMQSMQSMKDMNNIISGSNTLLKLFCCLTIIVLICILIGNYAFKNGLLTCDHYVFNTYLYIILAILLCFMVVLINDQTGAFNSLLIWMVQGNIVRIIMFFIAILIIYFALIYALFKVDPTNILASNAIWFLIVFMLGFILIPTIWLGRLSDVVGLAGILTIIITIIVGLAGYYYGDKIITFDWDYYLYIALWCLIIVIIIGSMLITDPATMTIFFYIISIISLLIFILLLLSNHKKLRENSEKCIDGKVVPNYPVESINIFIKILNIFTDLIRILSRLKRK